MSAPRLGRYELVRKIAAGGMAEIFLARQWGAGGFFRDVVIKRLFRHLAEHPRQLRMFQDEGRLLAALSHPSVPQVYDLGFADAHWYIAMEYVEGWNVADVWRQGAKTGQTMPLHVALGIVIQACEALHHAHERTDRAKRPLRIVHRDVTPQNIMLTRDGVVKLMDFGVAQTTARKDTEAGAVRGTFSYMAPEQVRAKPLDKRADVFALGVILYELTTGSRLFRGSDVQIMTQVVEHDVPPPSSFLADYPPDLEEVVLQALQRDRGRRTPSTAHLARSLEELAQRHALLIGPRAVARYVTQVIPNEPVQEDDLALVRPEVASPYAISAELSGDDIGGDDVHDDDEPAGPEIDDDGLLEDLQLLSMPAEQSAAGEPIPAPIRMPRSIDEDRATTPPPPPPEAADDDGIGLADILVEEPVSSRPPPGRAAPPARLPRGVVPLPRAPLALDGLDSLDGFQSLDGANETEEQRPVVLLGAPKKKSVRPPGGPGDYVRELEKRLSRDDDER